MRAIFLAALLVSAVPVAASAAPADVKSSVAATAARSEANVKLDESRKPAEVLKFLGLQQGMWVADPFGGNLDVYRSAADELTREIERVFDRIMSGRTSENP